MPSTVSYFCAGMDFSTLQSKKPFTQTLSPPILLYNARILVLATDLNTVHYYSWIAMQHGKIEALGTIHNEHEARSGIYTHYTQRDMKQMVVLPGLIDSHCHVYLTGKAMETLNVRACKSIEEMQQRLREYANTHKEEKWIIGQGWEQDQIGKMPHKNDLDKIVNDRPVVLHRVCHHIVVCNSKALEIAGITDEVEGGEGGAVDKDEHGRLTGIVREAAVERIIKKVTESREQRKRYIRTGLKHCSKLGLTAVQTNDGEIDAWSIYRELHDEGELPLRVFLTIQHSEIALKRVRAGETYGTLEMLEVHRVKLFGDGALGSETAALSMPYVQNHRCMSNHSPTQLEATEWKATENRGILIHSLESLTDKCRFARENGFRIELHAIGDRAAETGLEAFENAGVQPEERPILTHCQILSDSIVNRMKHMNAIANVQPQFVTTDSRWASQVLPTALWTWAYAWKSLMERGIVVAGGSDSPIELASPLLGMYTAAFRPDGSLHSKSAWRPEECLTMLQALHMYSAAGAYAAGHEQHSGRLAPGYWADLTVLTFDPIEQPERLLDTSVFEVWVAGIRRFSQDTNGDSR